MHLNKADDRSPRAEDRPLYEHDKASDALTPVRRAALDALEREFRDLPNARITT